MAESSLHPAESSGGSGPSEAPGGAGASGGSGGSARIKWYRCKVDKDEMKQLMQRSDWRGLMLQAVPHLLLIIATGGLACYAYYQAVWWLLPIALVLHGSFYGFWGLGGAGHELCHKTVFRSQWLNMVFLRFSSFISYFNYPLFIASHIKHHQYTLHEEHDLEVVLPSKLTWKAWVYATINPLGPWNVFKTQWRLARGKFEGEWENRLIRTDKTGKLKGQVMRWSQFILIGHTLLAVAFVASGYWFLLVVVTFAPFYCQWLNMLMGFPQHAGLISETSDFRLSCRTFIANPFFNFLYWQMNYHTEHHMYPGVPCHKLKQLRQAIDHDMPPAHRSLWATWREILSILKKQKEDPGYAFRQAVPTGEGHELATSDSEQIMSPSV